MSFQDEALIRAYGDYFGEKDVEISHVIDKPVVNGGIIKSEKLCADGNIGTVNEFGKLLGQMLNVIWGSNWGEVAPDTSGGLDHNNIKLPRITYSTNLREVAEGSTIKPTLSEVTMEEVSGTPTGEACKVYRQNFGCIVEFNVRASTSSDCSELAEKFEDAIILHSGFLKKKGVSEIFFLKEVPPRYSNYFSEFIPTKTLYFFVRLERIRTVKVSTLRELERKLEIIGKQPDNNSVGNTTRL